MEVQIVLGEEQIIDACVAHLRANGLQPVGSLEIEIDEDDDSGTVVTVRGAVRTAAGAAEGD